MLFPSSLTHSRFFPSAIVACILALTSGCDNERDSQAVENAGKKRGVPVAGKTPAENSTRLVSQSSGPIIIDEPGEAPFNSAYKGGVAQKVLPALYLDNSGTASHGKLTFVASAAMKTGSLAANEILSLDSPQIVYGGQLSGTLNVPANGDTLRLLWIDEAGRVVASQEYVPPPGLNGGTFTFKMPKGTFGHQHKLALVRVMANGGNVKVEAVESFRINESLFWDDYVVLSAGDVAQKSFPANAARLEAALLPDENPLLIKKWPTLADAYAKSRETKLFERQPPIFNEEAIAATKIAVEKNIDRRASGLSLWSVGDGYEFSNNGLPFDYDMSSETLETFRDWLQSRYGSLKQLNLQWKTNFAGWDKVVPPTTDEAKSAMNPIYAKRLSTLKKGDPEKTLDWRGDEPAFFLAQKELHNPANENLSGWADFRTFNDFAFARVLRECRKFTADKDRTAQIGFINAQSPSAWGGWDYQNLTRSIDWMEEHNSVVAREVLRGLSPQMHYLSAAKGQDAAAIHRLWDRWLRGDNGCLLPAADGAPVPLEDIGELTRGVTMLRNEAVARVDPIAIYYSPRSIYVHWMFDSEVQGSTWLRRNGREDAVHGTMNLEFKSWLLLLEDLGYSPFFIHPEEVAAGGLHYPDTKVLILPKVVALSQNEAKVIRDFVEDGGCVIADGQCGTFDGMGKRRGPLGTDTKSVGTLDADFGIQRKDFQALERGGEFKGDPASSRLTLRGKANKPVGAESPELRLMEPGVSATTGVPHATSMGGGKAMFSKVSGKGRYFYLNLCIQDYALLRADKTAVGFKYNGLTDEAYAAKYGAPTGGEALRLSISDIVDEWVGENPLHITVGAPSVPARGLKRQRFELGGGAAFYAIMPLADAGGEEVPEIKGAPFDAVVPAVVGDGKPHCWYDMRRGEALGSAEVVSVKLEPDRPTLLAALPYLVEKVSLKVRRTDQARTFKLGIELIIAGAMPGRHVFHVEVFDPTGKPMPYYTTNLSAENGVCTHLIALGVNEPAGTYHVKIRDVLTGKTAEGDLLKEGVEYSGLSFEPKKL